MFIWRSKPSAANLFWYRALRCQGFERPSSECSACASWDCLEHHQLASRCGLKTATSNYDDQWWTSFECSWCGALRLQHSNSRFGTTLFCSTRGLPLEQKLWQEEEDDDHASKWWCTNLQTLCIRKPQTLKNDSHSLNQPQSHYVCLIILHPPHGTACLLLWSPF